jgi:hypothetical protein
MPKVFCHRKNTLFDKIEVLGFVSFFDDDLAFRIRFRFHKQVSILRDSFEAVEILHKRD